MTKKRGLGKGLGALISSSTASTPSDTATATPVDDDVESFSVLPVDQIIPNPHQPRQIKNEIQLQELADSIKEHGVIQPLIVTQAEGGGYHLIAGERRWRASQLAGLQHVPVIIKQSTPQEMLELALVENIQRADLNILEEAVAYTQLIEEFGLTQEQVAQRVGKSRAAVANTVRLLNLPDEAKQMLISNQISGGHARAILSLKEHSQQLHALKTIISKNMNVRQTETFVKRLQQSTTLITPPPRPELRSMATQQDRTLATKFADKLGTKVELKRTTPERGKITIHFFSEEELQAIFEAILGQEEAL